MATQKKVLSWVVPIAVVLIAAALIGYILGRSSGNDDAAPAPVDTAANAPAQGPKPPSQVQQPGTPDYRSLERLQDGDPLAMGAVNAPVVMVGFSDYQCPFCGKWSGETLPQLQPYVDAGQLRIEWYDIAIFGDDSHRGALAAYAAGQQGKFWEFHEALFPDGQLLSPSELNEDNLIAMAGDLGLDVDQFEADFASPEVEEAVAANMQTGVDFGVFSTPSFIINGEPIVGAQPTPVFTQAIDAALDASN